MSRSLRICLRRSVRFPLLPLCLALLLLLAQFVVSVLSLFVDTSRLGKCRLTFRNVRYELFDECTRALD